jgi:hypothetical protein
MVLRQVSKPAVPRKPGKNSHRTATFREVARDIVHKDRYDRRAGMSVDTAGSIARALERAYAQGFVDAQKTSWPTSEISEADGNSPGRSSAEPVEWILIPPRPRDAFWTICRFTFGRETASMENASGHLFPVETPRGTTGWLFISLNGFEKPFGQTTILPLLRLGLLQPEDEPDPRLVVSELGRTTWRRFVERGGHWPSDLTSPAGEGDAR